MVEESQVTSQKVFHKVYFEHPIWLVVHIKDIFSSWATIIQNSFPDNQGMASIRLDTRKCQSYRYKLKADKSDPEYSISTTGYFESKCRKSSKGNLV